MTKPNSQSNFQFHSMLFLGRYSAIVFLSPFIFSPFLQNATGSDDEALGNHHSIKGGYDRPVRVCQEGRTTAEALRNLKVAIVLYARDREAARRNVELFEITAFKNDRPHYQACTFGRFKKPEGPYEPYHGPDPVSDR